MAVLVTITMVGLDRFANWLGWRFPRVSTILDGAPTVLIERGRALDDRLREHRIDMSEVLERARTSQGIRSADEIDYAILERSGAISIIPKRS
jgi:uncharacterized membrane protein YcaP (DUF421 family)